LFSVDDQIDKLAAQDVCIYSSINMACTDDPQIELVVNKLMEIGRSIIKGNNIGAMQQNESERALQSLKWMTRAFSIIDKGDKESMVPPALRVCLASLYSITY
jgi:hypothetical protein